MTISTERRCVTCLPDGWSKRIVGREGWTYWVPGYVGDLKVGDWIIVEHPRDALGGLVDQSGIPILAQVSDVKPPDSMRKMATRWIVGKIEWEPYRAMQALAPKIEGVD